MNRRVRSTPFLLCAMLLVMVQPSKAEIIAAARKAAPPRAYVQSGPGGVFYARCIPPKPGDAADTGHTDIYQVDGETDTRVDHYDWFASGGVVLGWSPIAGKVAVMAAFETRTNPPTDRQQQEELRLALGGKVIAHYTTAELVALGADEVISKPGGLHAAYRLIGCEQVPGTNEYDFIVELAPGKQLRFDILTGKPRVPK